MKQLIVYRKESLRPIDDPDVDHRRNCRELLEEVERLREFVTKADDRFGHFAPMHRAGADASPAVLLGELAHLVHEAAMAAKAT